jgi:hypothetical protein
MNINTSFMENHVFREKTSEQNGGGNDSIDFSPYSQKIVTGGVPITKLLSKSTPHIKSLSHLGVPAGLISTTFSKISGGKRKTESSTTKKYASHDTNLTNTLFSKIEHGS